MCAQNHPKKAVVGLWSSNTGEGGKVNWLLFPQIYLKIRGCVLISLFVLTTGFVFSFIHLVLHHSPTPFVMACLDSPSDLLSNRIFALSWWVETAGQE